MRTPTPTPPVLAEWLLRLVLPGNVVGRAIAGDLREEFGRRAVRIPNTSRAWYLREAWSVGIHALKDRLTQRAVWGRATAVPHTANKEKDSIMPQLFRDLRYAVRTLSRAKGFTLISVITLALGIGTNTAIFSVVNGVLIQPLPFPKSDQLVAVRHTVPGLGYDNIGISPGIYFQYRDQNDFFEDVGLYNRFETNLTGDGDPERVGTATMSRSTFSVLNVPPTRGRFFTEEEDLPNGPSVVMMSQALWQRRFGADPDIIGRTLQLNGVTREIVGVMPSGFHFPNDETDLWLPLGIDPDQACAGCFSFNAVARLKPGITAEMAEPRLQVLVARLNETYADQQMFVAFLTRGEFGALVKPMKEQIVGDLQRPLWIILGTVGLVLLIACANVANLFMVRAEARQLEMAVRTALGAGRGALMRQYLAEAFVLSGVGGVLGLTLAWAGVPALLRLAPETLPRLDAVSIDPVVLLFTLGITSLAAVVFGTAPVFRYTRPGLVAAVKGSGRGSVGPAKHHARNTLVVLQTGLAVVLLVGSGLLVRSFWEIRSTDPGFDASNVLTFSLALPEAEYPDAPQAARFHQDLLDRLAALPGVESVGAVSAVPVGTGRSGTAHFIEDFPTSPDELPPIFWYKYTTPGYFETMRIPLRSGRTFETRDHETNLGNIIVSATIAERFWPGEDVIGKRITPGDTTAWNTIVGVVGSVLDQGFREDPTEIVYYPMVSNSEVAPWVTRNLTYVVRSANPTNLAAAARAQVWGMDPDLPITSMGTMEEVVAASVVRLSFTMLSLGIAAFMALVLGAIGLYGVLSYSVSQRVQEIGVRIALGAKAEDVRKMVVWQGARIALVGLVVGLAGAAGLTRLLQSLLYDTAAMDPLTFGTMALVLFGVGLLASYLPARRASLIDPIEAIRMD